MRVGVEVTCSVCDHHKALQPPVDLRPSRPRSMAIELNAVMSAVPNDVLEQVNIGPPRITYDGPLAQRDSRELISEMIEISSTERQSSGFGMRPRDQAQPIESVGYRYVGVDYSSPSADLLADAHSIPFADNSFECVFSYAVLEHLHSPSGRCWPQLTGSMRGRLGWRHAAKRGPSGISSSMRCTVLEASVSRWRR